MSITHRLYPRVPEYIRGKFNNFGTHADDTHYQGKTVRCFWCLIQMVIHVVLPGGVLDRAVQVGGQNKGFKCFQQTNGDEMGEN